MTRCVIVKGKAVVKSEAVERKFVTCEEARELSKQVGLRIFWRPNSLVDPERRNTNMAEVLA